MYSVKADILGELRGNEEVVVLRDPFREAAEAFEEIFDRWERKR